jgi:hypothetical protein
MAQLARFLRGNLTKRMGVHIIPPEMNEEYLQRIKKTLLVILKAREFPNEVALLGLASRWEPQPVDNNNHYDNNNLWELNIYLPAEAYARMDQERFSESAEIIKSALNEIAGPRLDAFVSLCFCPELVDELTFTQEQLIEWLAEKLPANHHLTANN